MGFNYGREKKKFDYEWAKLEVEYATAGFCEEGITAMREYDWELFKKRRSYQRREQQLPFEGVSDEHSDGNSILFKKYPSLTSELEDDGFAGRFGWVQHIENPALVRTLVALPDSDKELLTLLIFDGYKHREIAAMQGSTRQAVSKKINRLKKLFKFVLEQGCQKVLLDAYTVG